MRAKSRGAVFLVVLSAIVSSQAYAQAITMRCQEDSLGPEQARGRVAWYAKNYPNEILRMATSVIGRELTPQQALTWYNKTMLEDPIFGGPSEYPRYPTFATPELMNPDPKYFAPIDPNASADKPPNFVWIGSCLSGR